MSAGTLERGASRKRAAVTSKRDRLVSRLEAWCHAEGIDLQVTGADACVFDDEPMSLGAAASRAHSLAPASWEATDQSRAEAWIDKLEYEPKIDYARALLACARDGSTLPRCWAEMSRPWMAKVEDKLSRLGVPVGSILVASEREWERS